MADLNVSLGLQADGLINGATQAVRALDGMNRTAQNLSKKLLEQNTLLKGGEDALARYRIENAKLTDVQRAAMLALHEENVAIRKRAQAQAAAVAAEKAAAAERAAAAKEWQAAFDKQEIERKKEAQATLKAEKAKQTAINQTIAAMKAEAAAMGILPLSRNCMNCVCKVRQKRN